MQAPESSRIKRIDFIKSCNNLEILAIRDGFMAIILERGLEVVTDLQIEMIAAHYVNVGRRRGRLNRRNRRVAGGLG